MFQVKWHWHNLKGKRGLFILGLLLSVITMILVIINPKFTQVLIDRVLLGGETTLLLPVLGVMCGLLFVRTLLRYAMVMCLEVSSQHTVIKVRERVFHTLQNQDASFYSLYRTGDLMTRVTGDIDLIRHYTAWIVFQITDSLTLFTAALIMLGSIHLPLMLMLILVTPVIGFVSIIFTKKIRPMFSVQREKLSALNTYAQENIAANRVVKAFAREDFEIGRFKVKNEAFRTATLSVNRTWLKFLPIIEGAASVLVVITLLGGGLFIMNGSLTFGELSVFMGLTWTISNPMRMLGTILNDLQRFFVSADKLIEIFYSRPLIADPAEKGDYQVPLKGEIEFRDVTFKYKNSLVLNGVSFKVNPGETIGIMGPIGSGKTTVAELIVRLHDPQSGQVLIDGIPTNNYMLNDLRSSIGMASQEVFLFSDTVDGNISYGVPHISESETKGFAQTAAAHDFIENMPEGYDTIVGERGVGLSGGQRQRIALARALAKRPPILILDDTTSALDSKTEEYIRHQLRNLDFPCTKIIIGQRISSVRDADKIIILENGSITIGTHHELASKPGYYREICALQNTSELPDVQEQLLARA